MNKIILILMLFPLLISAQKIDRKVHYDYSDKVEFRIYQLKKQRMIDRGSANYSNTIIAKKGKRFISIVLEFNNKSSETQIIDFEKIFIQDNNSELHSIDFVLAAMKLTGKTNKMQQKLKANKKRKIAIEFQPSFDKNEIIDTFVIDGKIIELKYKG
ncbi:hypothetical protein [Lacinutrix sp. MEBiC02595]